jgi:hypothetical protein
VATNSVREARRAAAFARLQPVFPLKITMTDAELPDGARLDDDEFLVRTAKDWKISIKSLVLTTRRLFGPEDLTGRTTVSLLLTDVVNVTLRKHLIGFSTIVVEARDGQQASFPAHINGNLVRSDIAAAADYAKRSAGLNPSIAAASGPAGDRYEQLRTISELKQSGVLTEAEFEEEKARILKQS